MPISRHRVITLLAGGLVSLTLSACDVEDDIEGDPAEEEMYRSLPSAWSTVNFVNQNSGKCIDLENGSPDDGANIRQWPCNGATAQEFVLEPASGGYVLLRNVASNKCVDVFEWSTSPGGNIAQWACHGGDNQQFMLEETSNGVATIRSRLSNLALDVENFSTADGANIMQWDAHSGTNQQFAVVPAGGNPPPPPGGCGGGGLSNVYVSSTIVVGPGQTFDGCGKRYISDGLGDGSQSESQKPIFRVEEGATLLNVTLGAPAADGIHVYPDGGTVWMQNIVWEDIGEDAMTIKDEGTVFLDGGSAQYGSDKVFQINAASTFHLSNFSAHDAGKMIRQNGGSTYPVHVFIDDCDITGMDEVIFRTDSASSHVTMTNSSYCDLDDGLFRFGGTNVGPGQYHPQATTSNNSGC